MNIIRNRKRGWLGAYQARSHFLLNKYTLRIKDPEIENELTKRRIERFQTLLVPVSIILTSGTVVFGLGDAMTGSENLKVFCYFLPFWIPQLYWVLCGKFKPKLAPYYSFLLLFLNLLTITLGYWGMLPTWLKIARPDLEDDGVYF